MLGETIRVGTNTVSLHNSSSICIHKLLGQHIIMRVQLLPPSFGPFYFLAEGAAIALLLTL